ncbi:PepSY-like domain-containing protein [Flaviaesturariibacter flavus]|nr:PepSY-like domain-containing protein [Flaviaesturariibacter flavus]
MKKHLFSACAAVMLLAACGSSRTSTMSTSSNNAAYGAPSSVTSAFTTQFPGATNITWSAYDSRTSPVDWELVGWPALTSNDYMVTFDQYGNRYYAWYDSQGNWIGSATAITNMASLPGRISEMITTQYQGYTVETVQRNSWKGHNAYEIKLRNYDKKVKVLVDDNGTVLKQKEKVE